MLLSQIITVKKIFVKKAVLKNIVIVKKYGLDYMLIK